jgi:hypothetical protein
VKGYSDLSTADTQLTFKHEEFKGGEFTFTLTLSTYVTTEGPFNINWKIVDECKEKPLKFGESSKDGIVITVTKTATEKKLSDDTWIEMLEDKTSKCIKPKSGIIVNDNLGTDNT